MAYTLQSKVGELLKDAEAVKVVEKYSPGLKINDWTCERHDP